MKIGLVGKPNVGKSSFFKALTMSEAEVGDYPFTTIDPNVGVGYVKVDCVCKEFGVRCQPRHGFCLDGNRFVPVEVIDVAGLVPGAHEGKGLGNKFLDDLRQADVLIHVIDASGKTNEKGEKTDDYDPRNDVLFLEEEMNMWIFGILKRNWGKISRLELQKTKEKEELLYDVLSGLKVSIESIKNILKEENLEYVRMENWSDEDIKKFASRIREENKPIVIAANKADHPDARKHIERIKKEFPEKIIIPTSAQSELALKLASKMGAIKYIPGDSDFKIIDESKLDKKQKQALEFIRENVLKVWGSTGVQKTVDTAVFDVLKYIAVYPGGVNKLADSEGRILPDCFLMPPGSTALDFAYKIHKDLGDNFIRAIDVRTKMVLGKDYKLKHRDVIEIVARA